MRRSLLALCLSVLVIGTGCTTSGSATPEPSAGSLAMLGTVPPKVFSGTEADIVSCEERDNRHRAVVEVRNTTDSPVMFRGLTAQVGRSSIDVSGWGGDLGGVGLRRRGVHPR